MFGAWQDVALRDSGEHIARAQLLLSSVKTGATTNEADCFIVSVDEEHESAVWMASERDASACVARPRVGTR